jgi:hypothetical protein
VRSLVLEWNDSCMHILMFWHEHWRGETNNLKS